MFSKGRDRWVKLLLVDENDPLANLQKLQSNTETSISLYVHRRGLQMS